MDYTQLIINNLEGGYYHPDMVKKYPEFFGKGKDEKKYQNYLNSGETMFGMDRKAGAPTTTTGRMVEFWQLIDQYYTPHHGDINWWNEKGGTFGQKSNYGQPSGVPVAVGAKLKLLAAQTMQEYCEKKIKEKITPAALQNIIKNNPKLFVQFYYACYNGPAFFNNLASVVNSAYKSGTTDAEQLYNVASNYRRQYYGNDNADKVHNAALKAVGESSGGTLKWILIAAAAMGAIVLIKNR